MFCYKWYANREQGDASHVLQNDSEFLTMKDINEAADFCKLFVEKKMHHSKESTNIVFTNIIKLNHCTSTEFYGDSE